MRRDRAEIGDAIRRIIPVSQSLAEAVRVTWPESGHDAPLIVEASERLTLRDWAYENRDRILGWLRLYGAALFRGFQMDSTKLFGETVDAMMGGRISYLNRSSPRTTVDDRIYTSTDYPNHLPIFPHNEHGYSPVFPLYIFFCCFQPAETGGATPVGSTRLVGAGVPSRIRDRFREKGIMYLRNYHEGFGLPWQKAFQTTDRSQVERFCREHGVMCEWRDGDALRTRRIGPAEITHPYTGELIWFNHGTFYHVTTLPAAICDELSSGFDEDDLPNHTYYGDGSPIEADVLDELRSAYLNSVRRFEWRKGDMLALDNVLAVHARDPFTGPRRVLVSMAEEIRLT
jgi:TfdA family taurine catabolism dioxygenase TauD